jgi:hypothetical protein
MEKQEQFISNLKIEYKNVLKQYMLESHNDINRFLRKKNIETVDVTPEYKQVLFDQIKILETIFKTIPILEQSLTVYRGIDTPEQTTGSFISTSLKIDIAREFTSSKSPKILKILVSPGSKVIPLYVIDDYESEVLLDKRGSFYVTGQSDTLTYVTYFPDNSKEIVFESKE